MFPTTKVIKTYISIEGKDPFQDWFNKLKDSKIRFIIRTRLNRLAAGNPGDHRWVGESVVELRIDWGPGYRIYYIEHGKEIVILLCGGDKSSEKKDILKAQQYCHEFRGKP